MVKFIDWGKLRERLLIWIALEEFRHGQLTASAVVDAGGACLEQRSAEDNFTPDLKGATLRGADLQGANLKDADLEGADLQGADLRKACLNGAILLRASLNMANLQGADLKAAILAGVTDRGLLSGADLRGANVESLWADGADKLSDPPLAWSEFWRGGLTQDQLDGMFGDSATLIPDELTRPAHWEKTHPGKNAPHANDGDIFGADEAEESEQAADRPDPISITLPTEPPRVAKAGVREGQMVALDQAGAEDDTAEVLYTHIRDEINRLLNNPTLGNHVSADFMRSLEKFKASAPASFAEMNQVVFGLAGMTYRAPFHQRRGGAGC